MLPSESRFYFTRGESHPFALVPGFPFDDVLADVRRRVEEWREIAKAIPSTTMVLRRTSRLPLSSGPITLSPEEFERGKQLFLGQERDAAQETIRLLTQLHSLRRSGVLSESEFNMKKWDLLSRS